MERDILTSDAFFVLRRSVDAYEEAIRLAQSGDEELCGMVLNFGESLEEFLRGEYEDLKAHVKLLHPSVDESELIKACAKVFSESLEELKKVYNRIVEARNSLLSNHKLTL